MRLAPIHFTAETIEGGGLVEAPIFFEVLPGIMRCDRRAAIVLDLRDRR
jgi:hypothetical protein